MQPFDTTESAFTSTAGNIVPGTNQQLDFTKWGNPERQKINQSAPAVNLYNYRRYGVW